MKSRLVTLVFLLAMCGGCGPSQTEFEEYQRRNEASLKELASLKKEVGELKASLSTKNAEIEELKFGAARLLAEAKTAKDDGVAIERLTALVERHPSSNESAEANRLLAEAKARIAAAEAQKKRDAELRAEEARLAQERALRNMKRNTDEIKGITWIQHRNQPILGKYVALYFGTTAGVPMPLPLRVKFQYSADDWLFVKSLIIKADDEVFEMRGLDFERDNGSGTIWEWIDMPVTDQRMLQALMKAKKVVIRFDGNQYYSDMTLSQGQQQQLREVYEVWKGMGGKS